MKDAANLPPRIDPPNVLRKRAPVMMKERILLRFPWLWGRRRSFRSRHHTPFGRSAEILLPARRLLCCGALAHTCHRTQSTTITSPRKVPPPPRRSRLPPVESCSVLKIHRERKEWELAGVSNGFGSRWLETAQPKLTAP
eukprot:scaffold1282_cov251-Pinguiococcus_pyrenoidosus.AAC.21